MVWLTLSLLTLLTSFARAQTSRAATAHTRHHARANFVVNLLVALIAYTYQAKKRSLSLRPELLKALPAMVF